MTLTLKLPPLVDIPSASEMQKEWLNQLTSPQDTIIDCSSLETFSAAGAQLILALSHMLKSTGAVLTLEHIPDSMKDDFITLGLPEYT